MRNRRPEDLGPRGRHLRAPGRALRGDSADRVAGSAASAVAAVAAVRPGLSEAVGVEGGDQMTAAQDDGEAEQGKWDQLWVIQLNDSSGEIEVKRLK